MTKHQDRKADRIDMSRSSSQSELLDERCYCGRWQLPHIHSLRGHSTLSVRYRR